MIWLLSLCSALAAAEAAAAAAAAGIRVYYHQLIANHASAAQQVISDGFQLRDHPPYPLSPPVDWSADPHSDSNWRYQLNAMYPLAPIFQGLAESDRPEWREFARAVFLDWIEFNLDQDLPNDFKWNDMATGVRAAYLAHLIAHERTAGQIFDHELHRLLKAGREHVRVLADPERLAENNHGIFQMVGIAALCEVEAYAECGEAMPYARARYDDLFYNQFSAEGMHLEHSPEYHHLAVNTFVKIHDSGLLQLSASQAATLRMAQKNLQWWLHPDGGFAELGDTEAESAAGVQQHDPGARWIRSRGRTGEAPAFGAAAFPQTGYAFTRLSGRVGDSYLALSVAHHSWVHKHADSFSFEWSDRGRRVLVDSGKWGYDQGPEREYATGPLAHNVVVLEDERFSAGNPPPVLPRVAADVRDGIAIMSAVGRRGAGSWTDAFQERWLALDPSEWLVVADEVVSFRPRSAVQWFQLPPDAELEQMQDSFNVRFPWSDSTLSVFTLGEVAGLEARRGEQGEQWSGWYSPGYHELVPSWQIGFRSWGFRHRFRTVFRWVDPGEEIPVPDARFREDSSAFCWSEGTRTEGIRVLANDDGETVLSACE